MTARILTALCFCLALSGANAQTTPPDAKAAVRETPPDRRLTRRRAKSPIPRRKSRLYEKLKTDYPDGAYASMADSQIFSTLIQKMPEQTDRIRKAAKAMFAASVAKDKADSKENMFATMASRGSTASRIADQLVAADLLLKDAESYARKGVEAMQENMWMAERREAYAKRKQKIPSQLGVGQEFRGGSRGTRRTLGRVEVKLGRTARRRSCWKNPTPSRRPMRLWQAPWASWRRNPATTPRRWSI